MSPTVPFTSQPRAALQPLPGARLNPNAPRAIQQISDSRGGPGAEQAVHETVAEIQTRLEQTASVTKDELAAFIDSMRCG